MTDYQDMQPANNARQLIFIGLSVIIIAALVFALWYWIIRTPMAPAFTGLKSSDASVIIGELKRQKTPYELADDGTTILVPKDQVDASRIGILGGDLPLKGTVGFELFNKTDMGLTDFAQKINYQRALQGELARTLMSLDNIETARVHLSLPDSEVFQEDKRPPKASVTLTPKMGRTVDGGTVAGVQRMVASAVPDLEAANVSVLDGGGQVLSQDVAPSLPKIEDGIQMGAIQQFYAAKVREAIAPILSDPTMRITVWTPADARLTDASAETTGLDKNGSIGSKTVRNFPIRISIATPGVPDSSIRQRLIPFLSQSVGYDPLQGDSLSLLSLPISSDISVTTPGGSTPPVPNPPSMPQTPTGWGDQSALLTFNWLPVIFGMIGAFLLFLVIRWVIRRREMTDAKREIFADRLKMLLDQREEVNRGG